MNRVVFSLLMLALGWLTAPLAFAQPAPSARVKITAAGQDPVTGPHQPILALPASGSVSATLTAQSFNFTPTSFAWSQVAPTDVLAQHLHAAQALVTFSATTGSQVTATFPARGIYQLQLTASNGTTSVTAPVWIQVWDRLSGFNPLLRIGRNPGLTPPPSMRQLTPDPGPFQHPRLLFTDADWSELNAKTTTSTEVAAAIAALTSALNSNFDKTTAPAGVLSTYANALVAWADGGFTDDAYTANVQPVRQFEERFRFGNEPNNYLPDALLVAAYLQWIKVNPALAQSSVPSADQTRFRYLAKVSAAAARAELVRVRLGAAASPAPTIPFSHDMAVVYDLLYDWMTEAQRTDLRDYLFTIGYGYYNNGNGGLQRSPMTAASYSANGDFPNQMDPALLSGLAIEGEESAVTPSVVAANVAVAPAATGPAAWPNASPASVWNAYRMARWYSERLITPWGAPLNHQSYLDFSTGFSGPAMLALARRGQNVFVTSNLYQTSLHAFNNLNPRPSDGAMVMWDHHDSLGFGTGPNVYAGRYLARYLWPDDPLIDYVYRSFRAEVSSPLLTAIFHIDHAPSTLAQTAQSKGLSLTRFDPYRGYGVTRNTWGENDLSLYFESRPDVQGHMHAEANNFSLYALGRAWACPSGYHITINEASSTILIQNPTLAATDTVTEGYVGQSGSSSTTSQTSSQFPTPPGKILEATEDPAGRWTLFAGDATLAYQYAFERDQPQVDTGRRVADMFYGEALSQMFAGYDPTADTATLKVSNLAYNPVQYAIRSVFSVRGSKPYVLVIDDITADGVNPRNYRWNMSAAVSFGNAGGRFVDANNDDIFSSLRLKSGATSSDAVLFHLRDSASGPRLLVRDLSPKAAGQPAIFIDTRPSNDSRGALSYGYDNNLHQFSTISTNRLLIPRNNVVSPDYKVLLFPHQSGSSLPLTSWNADQTVATIDLRDGFTDRLTFDSTRSDHRTRVVAYTRTFSGRSAPSLTLPADIAAPASTATLSFNGQPGAAVTFAIAAASDTAAMLTPSVSSPSGTVFPIGTHTVYVTATDSVGQVSSGQFTVTVTPPAPSNLAVTPSYATNTLTWTAADSTSSLLVKRATSAGGPYAVVATLAPGVTTYTDVGLASSVTYYYVVAAAFSGLESATTAEVGGLTPASGVALKANNTTSLDQASSWSQAVVPAAVDSASWNGTYSNGTVSIGGGLAVKSVIIASPSNDITITPGSGNLTLGGGGFDLSAATKNLTVNAPVVLAGNQSWSVASGRILTVGGSLGESGGARTLTLTGPGTVAFSGNNTLGGGLVLAPPAGGQPTYKFGGNNPAAIAQLTGGAFPAPITANGRLDLAAALSSLGPISGSGSAGLIANSSTTAQVLTFVGGSSFSMFQVGADNARATLRQSGSGGVSFSFFGYNNNAPNARHTLDGGTWTLGQIGQNNSNAQTSGTVVLTGGAYVTISAQTGFSHGTWQVTNGTLRFLGNISAANGSATGTNTSLVFLIDNSGGGPGQLTSTGGLTLADGGSAANVNALTIGTGGTVTLGGGLTLGSTTARTAETDTVTLQAGGKLLVPGTVSAATSATGQTRTFNWTGGQLTAATLTSGAGFAVPASGGLGSTALVQNAGTLAPGDVGTAGKTAITGAYSLGAAGTLAIDIGGLTQATAYQTGQYDYVTVSGTTTFSGSLAVSLINGFKPSNANSFTVLNSTGALTGTFNQRVATTGDEGSFLVSQVGNTITLSQYLNALDTWRLANYGTTANTGNAADTADPDGDGASNLLEYALKTNPTSAASVSVPTAQVSGSKLQLSFFRARADVTYYVESSADLASWDIIATNPGSPGTTVIVTDLVNLTTTPRRFMRLRITNP